MFNLEILDALISYALTFKFRESYAASMCPDCEGYHCQEGFECQMIDEAPTCVEKQTGCDIDK